MHIVYSFPHVIGRPGIGTTARHQVEGAARQGLSVTLFCAGVEGALDPRIKVVQTVAAGRVRIPHRALGVHRSYRWHDRVVASRLRHLGTVDLVHVWPAGCVQTLRAAAALRIPAAREVPNTHTAYAFEAVAQEFAHLKMAPLPGHSHTASREALDREELEYHLASVLLVPSDFSMQTFLDRGFAQDRLALPQYGFDPAEFSLPSTSARVADQGLRALFMGRCEPRKGVHLALRSWIESGAARRGRFVICGTFVDGYASALGDLLLHPSVEVRGFVAEPGAMMRAHDILLLPSVEEGSALVTYEAQASGCVPVVSDAAGARLVHGVSGLVHPARDTDTLTAQLAHLDASPTQLDLLRRGAFENSRTLTWDAAAEVLATVYDRVCSTPSAGHFA